MPLTGYRIVHVDAYSYRRKFTVKGKADSKPKAKKAPAKRRGGKKKASGYDFASFDWSTPQILRVTTEGANSRTRAMF